jgi:CheY-like chemotaxis protein
MDERPSHAGHVIVLVEDHDDTRELTRELLEMEGHTVTAYADGLSALAGLRRMPVLPCVLLLDVRIPGMSGLELLRELRNDPALARVPVILTTACSHEAVAHLHVPFLRKPFDPDLLLQVVERQCRCDGHAAARMKGTG